MAKTTKSNTSSTKVQVKRKRPYRKKKYPAEKKCVCEICGNRYYYQSKLKEHSYIHTNEKPFKCDECDKAFNTSYSLKTHKYIHTDEKPFRCSYCEYACRDSSTLRKHQQNMHLGTFKVLQCNICDKTYKHRWQLRHHVSETHLQLDLRQLQCDICGKKFKTKSHITVHMQNVHLKRKECECPVCGKTISNRANLPQHLITHTDHKPYLCPVEGCDKRYNCSSSLQKHRVRHFPDEQHECLQCGHLFPRASLLKRHFAVIHAERVKVICDYCGVSFISKAYLINHIKRKHTKKKKRYICDICGFKTYNKPSLVMHIKHGHGNEKDIECRICHTIYKRHAYLKSHYRKTHNIIYKTKVRKPKPPSPVPLEIKEEPLDLEDQPIDLFEIEKEETADVTDPQLEAEGRQVMKSYNNNINSVPRELFDRFYVKRGADHVVEADSQVRHKSKYKLDTKTKADAEESIAKLLELARQNDTTNTADEERKKNERVGRVSCGKKGTITLKYNNKTKVKSKHYKELSLKNKNNIQKNEESSQKNGEEQSNDEESLQNGGESAQNNGEATQNNGESTQNNGEATQNNGEATENNGKSYLKRPRRMVTRKKVYKENVQDNDDSDYEPNETGNKKSRLKFNTHQCYVCFKLFDTKDKLIDHCKDHFDICNEKSWKKCPLCDYVSGKYLARHLKLVHKIHIRMPSTIHDKKNNNEGCRYYLKVDNPVIKKIEIIPSIKNLNKMASLKIDRENRKNNSVGLTKTKLVRKGKEWVVEKETVNIKKTDYVLPKLDDKLIKDGDKDSYLNGLRKLYHESKKSGKKILFPCQHCDKICQNLSALKLHYRKHDPNAKPFAKKVWKHKLKNHEKIDESSQNKNDEDLSHRIAKPQPIRNNHKCSPELQEFYEKNIRGGNIEFWQFLKIFNRMSKDKVTDFKNFKEGYDYEIGRYINEEGNNVTENNDNVTDTTAASAGKEKTKGNQSSKNSNSVKVNKRASGTRNNIVKSKSINNETKVIKKLVKYNNNYKRTIGISKKQYLERELLKNELRRKNAKKTI